MRHETLNFKLICSFQQRPERKEEEERKEGNKRQICCLPHAAAGGGALLLNYMYRNLQDKLKIYDSEELNTHN